MTRAGRVLRPSTIETGTEAPSSGVTQTAAIRSTRSDDTVRPVRASIRRIRTGGMESGTRCPTCNRSVPGSAREEALEFGPTEVI